MCKNRNPVKKGNACKLIKISIEHFLMKTKENMKEISMRFHRTLTTHTHLIMWQVAVI